MSENHNKVYCYGRGSTWNQGLTLRIQKEKSKAIAHYKFGKGHGMGFGGFFGDRATSGGIPITERKMGGRMCLMLRPGDAIVVMKLDRAFRDAADAALMIKEWTSRGIDFYSDDCGLDSSTPIGRGMLMLLGVLAEMERERISERLRERSVRLAKEGRAVTGMKPWGIRVEERLDEEGKLRKYWVKDPKERRIMGIALAMHERQFILRDIAEKMNRRGLIPKERAIFYNRIYGAKVLKGGVWKWSIQTLSVAIRAERKLRKMEAANSQGPSPGSPSSPPTPSSA